MLLVKLIGIVLIVVSGAFLGFLKSYGLSLRYKKLLQFLDGINMLYENIEQGENELNTAIRNSFSRCNFLEFKNGNFVCCDFDLKKDKSTIDEFFIKLGSATKKTECDRINNFKLKIKSHLKEAEQDVAQKSKIYSSLGICLGLVVAILLI